MFSFIDTTPLYNEDFDQKFIFCNLNRNKNKKSKGKHFRKYTKIPFYTDNSK